jgi:hypothetical protein
VFKGISRGFKVFEAILTVALGFLTSLAGIIIGYRYVKRDLWKQVANQENQKLLVAVGDAFIGRAVSKITGSIGGTMSGISRGLQAGGVDIGNALIPGLGKQMKQNPLIALAAQFILPKILSGSQGNGEQTQSGTSENPYK